MFKKNGKKHEFDYFERTSLRNRLVRFNVLIVTIPILIISLIIFLQIRSALLIKSQEANTAYVNKVGAIINSKFQQVEDVSTLLLSNTNLINLLKKDINNYGSKYEMNLERKNVYDPQISSIKFSNSYIDSIFFIKESEVVETPDRDGNPIYNKEKFIEDFHQSEMYKKVKDANGKSVWFSDLFGTDKLTLLRNLKDINDGSNVAILAIMFNKDLIGNELITGETGPGSLMAIVDEDSKVILSVPDEGKTKLNQLDSLNNLKKKDSAAVQVVDGKEQIYYYKSCSNGWGYMLEVPFNLILKDINKIQNIIFIVLLISIVLSVMVGIFMAVSISSPIRYINTKIKMVENGDLTAVSEIRGKHELGQLSRSFNEMTVNMKGLIEKVVMVIEEIKKNSNTLNEVAVSIDTRANETMNALGQISEGANGQVNDALQTGGIISDLVKQMKKSENHFDKVVQFTEHTKESSARANTTLDLLDSSTRETWAYSERVEAEVVDLKKKYNEISKIVVLIEAICKDTDLLSINASVEAARAGKEGMGFVIIAKEIGKLSMNTRKAVQEISSIMDSIGNKVSQTVALVQDNGKIVLEQKKAVDNTRVIFEEVLLYMDRIAEEISDVKKLLDGQGEMKDAAVNATENIVSTAQQSAAAIEEIHATSCDQIAASELLLNICKGLNEALEQMKTNISKFSL